MGAEGINTIYAGLAVLLVLCAVDFMRFITAPVGHTPPFAGVTFVVTAVYCVLFAGPIADSARRRTADRTRRPLLDFLVYGFPASWVNPDSAPWAMAAVCAPMGIAMLLA